MSKKVDIMDINSAHRLAQDLMAKHGILYEGWRVQFDNAARRFGQCRYRRKIISLSRPLVELNDQPTVQNVILHEIAHALTPGHGHDGYWRYIARSIGCDGERCQDAKVIKTVPAKYEAVCSTCGHVHRKYRKPADHINRSCGLCSSSYDVKYKLEFKKV